VNSALGNRLAEQLSASQEVAVAKQNGRAVLGLYLCWDIGYHDWVSRGFLKSHRRNAEIACRLGSHRFLLNPS
jgi:hypothetical protein